MSAPETLRGTPTVVTPDRAQVAVARRAAESRATVPDVLVGLDVELTAALERLPPEGTAVDLVIRACALALPDFPRVNGGYRDARYELYPRVHVGVATMGGDHLTVPVVHDADRSSLPELAVALGRLRQRAVAGQLTPPELAGATFTVWTVEADRFTAIITPPQAAALAMGGVRDAAVVRTGAVVPGRVTTLTLSCDHRIVYPDEGARFLGRVRDLLETPDGL